MQRQEDPVSHLGTLLPSVARWAATSAPFPEGISILLDFPNLRNPFFIMPSCVVRLLGLPDNRAQPAQVGCLLARLVGSRPAIACFPSWRASRARAWGGPARRDQRRRDQRGRINVAPAQRSTWERSTSAPLAAHGRERSTWGRSRASRRDQRGPAGAPTRERSTPERSTWGLALGRQSQERAWGPPPWGPPPYPVGCVTKRSSNCLENPFGTGRSTTGCGRGDSRSPRQPGSRTPAGRRATAGAGATANRIRDSGWFHPLSEPSGARTADSSAAWE